MFVGFMFFLKFLRKLDCTPVKNEDQLKANARVMEVLFEHDVTVLREASVFRTARFPAEHKNDAALVEMATSLVAGYKCMGNAQVGRGCWTFFVDFP